MPSSLPYLCAALMLCASIAPLHAERICESPIDIVVPFPAGTAIDVATRLLSEKLSARLNEALVVKNRPGAHGQIAAQTVANAPSSGCVLGILNNGGFIINPAVRRFKGDKAPFDPTKDFTPIGQALEFAFVLVTTKDVPANTIQEFVQYAKRKVGALTMGQSTPLGQAALRLLQKHYEVDFTIVPFKGDNEVMPLLLSGKNDVQGAFVSYLAAREHLLKDNPTLKALAVYRKGQPEVLASVPSFKDIGITEVEEHGTLVALMAPAGLSQAKVAKLSQALKQALADPDLDAALRRQGIAPYFSSPQELSAAIARQIPAWDQLLLSKTVVLE